MAYIHARLIVPLETCIPVFERVSRSRAWKKWKGHFSWRNFLLLSVIFLSLLSSSDFFFFPLLFPKYEVYVITCIEELYTLVDFIEWCLESTKESLKLKVIYCVAVVGWVMNETWDKGVLEGAVWNGYWKIVVERTKGKSFDPRKCWSTWIGPGDLGSSWGRGKVVRCPEVGLEHRGPYRSSRTR